MTSIDIARAYYEQRAAVASEAPLFRRLIEAADVPPDAHAWLRLRVSVEPRASTLVLPIENLARPERLIIQTWAAPVAARVRIEELSLVW